MFPAREVNASACFHCGLPAADPPRGAAQRAPLPQDVLPTSIYDEPVAQRQFVTSIGENERETLLVIERISCHEAAIFILWPSFVVGGAAEVLVLTVFDPKELYFLAEPTSLSRLAVYSIGFFLCWAFAAASSALTCLLHRGAEEVN